MSSRPYSVPPGLARQDTMPAPADTPSVAGTKRPLDTSDPQPVRRAPLERQAAMPPPPRRYPGKTATAARDPAEVPHMGAPPMPQYYVPPQAPYPFPPPGAYAGYPYPPMPHLGAPFIQPGGPIPAPYGPAAYPPNMYGPAAAQNAEPTVPQDAAEARLLWERLDPAQREQLVRLFQSQQQGFAVPQASATANGARDDGIRNETLKPAEGEDIMAVDDEGDVNATPRDGGKGKGKVVDDQWPGDATMADAGFSSTPPQATAADGLTNQFGRMLLDHVQTSHDQMNKLMSDFMAQQNKVQELFRNVVVDELRAAHGKAQPVQNPLPFAGRKLGRGTKAAPGVDGSRTAPPPSSPRKRKRGTASASPDTETSPEMKDALKKLQGSVRVHLKKMLKFSTWEELVERHPALTDEEMKAFGTPKSTVVCTEDDFRIDFVHEWKRTPFNLFARDLFVQNLLQCIQGGAFGFKADIVPLITNVHVERSLDSHMDHCRRQYSQALLFLSLDSDDEEGLRQIAYHKEKVASIKKRKAKNSRKFTLLESRVFLIEFMELHHHLVLFEKLAPRNMSGDETDGDSRELPMAYRIIESRWQSVPFKTFMRTIDAANRKRWAQPGADARATGGNAPRTRLSRANGPVEDGYAPPGLWRNCYDADWLRSLPPYRRRALNIIDADYDFDLSELLEEDDSGTDGCEVSDIEMSQEDVDESELEAEEDL